jgi:hypothetical protein
MAAQCGWPLRRKGRESSPRKRLDAFRVIAMKKKYKTATSFLAISIAMVVADPFFSWTMIFATVFAIGGSLGCLACYEVLR